MGMFIAGGGPVWICCVYAMRNGERKVSKRLRAVLRAGLTSLCPLIRMHLHLLVSRPE